MSRLDKHDNPRDHVSEEDLHAFVDHQLDAEDRRRVRRAIRRYPELAQEICDLDQLKDWVQQAYAEPPLIPARRASRISLVGWRRALAASVLVGAGATIGWSASSSLATIPPVSESMAEATALTEDQAAMQATRIILHVGSSDRHTFDQALDTAESLLASAENEPDFHLQVLANSAGVDLVRSEVTPYAQRIGTILREHPNVEFTVCGQSLERLERRGESVAVLPNVKVVDTAVGEVARRMRQGWSYIRI